MIGRHINKAGIYHIHPDATKNSKEIKRRRPSFEYNMVPQTVPQDWQVVMLPPM